MLATWKSPQVKLDSFSRCDRTIWGVGTSQGGLTLDPERIQEAIRIVLHSRPQLPPLAQELGSQIVAGTLAPDTQLSEKIFGRQRNVSRTSFREAIKVLEGKGLVRSKQHTGTYATPRQEWNGLDPEILAWRIATGEIGGFLHDFFDFRSYLEPNAAKSAASGARKDQIRAARETLALMDELQASDPFGTEFVEADVRFHKAIFEAADNEFLQGMSRTLDVPMRLSFTLNSFLMVGPGDRLALHESVIDAIERGAGDEAFDASLALLTRVHQDIRRILPTTDR